MVIYFQFRECPAGISRLAKDETKRRNRTGRAVQAVSPLVQHSLSNPGQFNRSCVVESISDRCEGDNY